MPMHNVKDIQWIRGALQTAVTIEHATMPVYASAMYSLEVQNYPAYNILRSVMMEEMLHMAAAANMLAGLGGSPRIRTLDPTSLAQGLPAGIAPGLTARCAKLSRRQLDTFMRLESPTSLLDQNDNEAGQAGGTYRTIGEFYHTIKAAIIANADSVRAAARSTMRANQVGGNLGYACIDSRSRTDLIEQFVTSLDLIKDQGEGVTSTLDAGDRSHGEPSHYARFAELRYGRRYTGPKDLPAAAPRSESQRRHFQGETVPWPTVINMLAVPADGYDKALRSDPDRDKVLEDLAAFDSAYTRMLTALDQAWNGPVDQSWPSLGKAVMEMNELRVISCFRILRRPVPPSVLDCLEDTYGAAQYTDLAALTDLQATVYYGPRFRNTITAQH